MTERDEQLELKKRARRRLVGAAAFALLAVVALPMVMDETPPPNAPQVQIRIPGQDDPLPPPTAGKPAPAALATPATPATPATAADEGKVAAGNEPPAAVAVPAKSGEQVGERAGERAGEKLAEKTGSKAPEKSTAKAEGEKPLAKADAARGEAERAAAILQGKDGAEQHVILIGAFANPANVKTLQRKLAELGIKTYTEALESPTGRKTRLRAGPFATREAAEKARERMKRIGVSGVVSTKS